MEGKLVPQQEMEVLCIVDLHNVHNGRRIHARIAKPVFEIKQPSGEPEPYRHWGSMVTVEVDGTVHVRKVWSENWIGAVTLSLEYIRRFIPPGEEREWVDEEGLESWCIFPRAVPIAWGHDLYQQISRMVDDAERSFEEDVQRRRLAAEKRRHEDGK